MRARYLLLILALIVLVNLSTIVNAHSDCNLEPIPDDKGVELSAWYTGGGTPPIESCRTDGTGQACYMLASDSSNNYHTYLQYDLDYCDNNQGDEGLREEHLSYLHFKFSYGEDNQYEHDTKGALMEEDSKVYNHSNFVNDLTFPLTDNLTLHQFITGNEYCENVTAAGWWQCDVDMWAVKNYTDTNNIYDMDDRITIRLYGDANKLNYQFTVRGYNYQSSYSAYLKIKGDQPPLIEDCSDANTNMNSNGSSISVDLWGCHNDPDDSEDSWPIIFSIQYESNADLIDCYLDPIPPSDSERYLKCNAPAANQTGFSDVVVRATDHEYGKYDEDTIRVYVNSIGNVSVSVNNTQVYKRVSSINADLDIVSEVNSYLSVCEEDSNGLCQVPIEFESDANTNFDLNFIDIVYKMPEAEFADSLIYYLENVCSTENCTVPLKFGFDSKGKLNLSNLQIFYDTTFPIVTNIAGYGGDSGTSANYDLQFTLTPQPTGNRSSANYEVDLGWAFYEE